MIEVEETKLRDVLLIKPTAFEDHRGRYVEIFNQELYKKSGVDIHFVEDDISVSKQNVLRGIHGDPKTWKLISCLQGEIFFVVVDCNEESEHFGEWLSFTLSESNRHQVLVPPYYGNGHYVLTEQAIFHYKQSEYYDPNHQFTYKWDDERFSIDWPTKEPILSKRDTIGEYEWKAKEEKV